MISIHLTFVFTCVTVAPGRSKVTLVAHIPSLLGVALEPRSLVNPGTFVDGVEVSVRLIGCPSSQAPCLRFIKYML